MSRFNTGGTIVYDEAWWFWKHPDCGFEMIIPQDNEKDKNYDEMLREQNALLRKILSESDEIRIMSMMLKGDDGNDRA